MNKDKSEVVAVKNVHGYTHNVRLPRRLFKRFSLLLCNEVVVEVTDDNPFNWELKIKPRKPISPEHIE